LASALTAKGSSKRLPSVSTRNLGRATQTRLALPVVGPAVGLRRPWAEAWLAARRALSSDAKADGDLSLTVVGNQRFGVSKRSSSQMNGLIREVLASDVARSEADS
jgi:hypothetical protein